MDSQLLIDEIVRHTTVLIAQLATAGGARTPLADIAGQVFSDLASELHRQGVSRKVAADMFGMALRTYRRKVQRLGASQTVTGRSLWEAVHELVASRPGIGRVDVLRHFERDDEEIVRGVLQDLVESGLCYRSGKGALSTYRAVTRAEVDAEAGTRADTEGVDMLVWAVVYRLGPIDRPRLGERLALPARTLEDALARLGREGRVVTENGGASYRAPSFTVPLGTVRGWEAAVFDHFQAMVMTFCAKLGDGPVSAEGDEIGGSTYTFEVWPGHPHEAEARGELRAFRARLGELRRKIIEYNKTHELPARRTRVVVYGGQCVLAEETGEDDADE